MWNQYAGTSDKTSPSWQPTLFLTNTFSQTHLITFSWPKFLAKNQTLFQCDQTPVVVFGESVHKLKIPSTGTYTIIWTHENIAHTDRNG